MNVSTSEFVESLGFFDLQLTPALFTKRSSRSPRAVKVATPALMEARSSKSIKKNSRLPELVGYVSMMLETAIEPLDLERPVI